MSLLVELKQRRIWRVLLAYPGLVFVILQVVEFFINNYGLDHRFLTASIIGAVVLLPAAVLWNWRHGEEGRQRIKSLEVAAYAVSGLATIVAVGWYWSMAPAAIIPVADDLPVARSIAVLPFENAGDDADVQYLCDGIAESLINWLATVPGVKVISWSAALRFREHAGDTARLFEELGVDSLVRGQLERRGDEVIVSASLVDTRDDTQVWGERMVRPLADVMYLERSIVSAIKDELQLKVGDLASTPATAVSTDNPQAYQHYLRGHFLIQATDAEAITEGVEELRAAIAIDPGFALPYTDIANALSQSLLYGIDLGEGLQGEARNAAFTAVALAPELAEAQTALAAMHQNITLDWSAAEEAYETAISLSPQSPAPYHRYSDFLWATLRLDRAHEMALRALEIDPMDSSSMHAAGISLMYAGDFAGAAEAFNEWSRFYPGSIWARVKFALSLSLNGECEESAEPAATAERLLQGGGSITIDAWLAWGYRVCGRDDLYLQAQKRMEEKWGSEPDSPNFGVVFFKLMEGEEDDAMGMLQHMFDIRSPLVMYLQLFLLDVFEGVFPDSWSSDPRLREMIRSLDFPKTPWLVTD